MPEFAPRARENREKGRHPDLDENGEFRADVDLDPAQRDFYRMWQSEPERNAFMARIARQQAQLPRDVQEAVAGRDYGTDPWNGYLSYLADIHDLRRVGTNEFTGMDVDAMTLEEYDAVFDASGRPRQGMSYAPTTRDVDVSNRGSGIDPYSQQEFGRNR